MAMQHMTPQAGCGIRGAVSMGVRSFFFLMKNHNTAQAAAIHAAGHMVIM
jgi:hypothetical protein